MQVKKGDTASWRFSTNSPSGFTILCTFVLVREGNLEWARLFPTSWDSPYIFVSCWLMCIQPLLRLSYRNEKKKHQYALSTYLDKLDRWRRLLLLRANGKCRIDDDPECCASLLPRPGPLYLYFVRRAVYMLIFMYRNTCLRKDRYIDAGIENRRTMWSMGDVNLRLLSTYATC